MIEQVELKPSQLVPHRKNIRTDVGDVAALVESIKAQGILQPLLVTPNGKPGHYVVLAGHRRLAAAKKVKLSVVPCTIRHDLTDEAAQIAVMLGENIERSDLTPVEEAEGVLALFDLGESQKSIVARTGMSAARVRARAKIGKLSDDVKTKLTEHAVTLADAEFIANHADNTGDLEYLEAALGTNNWLVAKQRQLDRDADRRREQKLRKEIEALGIDVVTNWSDHRQRASSAAAQLGTTSREMVREDFRWPPKQAVLDRALATDTVAWVHVGANTYVGGSSAPDVLTVLSAPRDGNGDGATADADSSDVSDTPASKADSVPGPEVSAEREKAVRDRELRVAATTVRHQFIRDLIAAGDEADAALAARLGALTAGMVNEAEWSYAWPYLPVDRTDAANTKDDKVLQWFTEHRHSPASTLLAFVWMTIWDDADRALVEGPGGASYLSQNTLREVITYSQLLAELGYTLSDAELETVNAAAKSVAGE